MAVTVLGVMFDNDETLQFAERDYEWAYCVITKKYGCPQPDRILLLKLKGIGFPVIYETLVNEIGLPISYEEFMKHLNAELTKRALHAKLMPGAEPLIRRLHALHVPLGIATTSHSPIIRLSGYGTTIYASYSEQSCPAITPM